MKAKKSTSQKIREQLKAGVEVAKIAKQHEVTPQYVYQIRWQSKQKKVAKNDRPARAAKRIRQHKVSVALTNGHEVAAGNGSGPQVDIPAASVELAETLKSIRNRASSYRAFSESYVKELQEVKSFVDTELSNLAV